MGKIRTRVLGLEEEEKKQKVEQKKRAEDKKAHKVHLSGLKGGERMVEVEASEESLQKMEKAKKLIAEAPVAKTAADKKVKKIKAKARGENYQKAKKKIDKNKKYSLAEAIDILKKIKFANFDESVEIHLNVDEVGLRGEVVLPHPTGKTIRVKIVDDKFIDDFSDGKGKIDFDILITHPSFMMKLAKLAKILGPKGLMPNPKSGTISDKPEELAKKFSQGGLHWKTEPKAGLIHQMVGKISFPDKKLMENIKALFLSVGKHRIQAAFIKTTMSPAVKIDVEKT